MIEHWCLCLSDDLRKVVIMTVKLALEYDDAFDDWEAPATVQFRASLEAYVSDYLSNRDMLLLKSGPST